MLNRKLLLISLLFGFCNVLVAAGANQAPNHGPMMYYCPGTPPEPTQISNLAFRHEPNAVGTVAWEQDITDKLEHLEGLLPPDHAMQASALENSYDKHLTMMRKDCTRIEDFLKRMKSKEQIAYKEQQINHSYLEAIRKHYSDLSDLSFNLFQQNPQWANALQNLVLNRGKVEEVTEEVLGVKNKLEEFMDSFDLLPDDYDNGLI